MEPLAKVCLQDQRSYRLVSSRFPPISLFEDVADAADFRALYELQALTNPRLQNELGNINLIPQEQIPFGIPGCAYATAPFTHVNPEGSRFSDGAFGVLYLADTMDTAIAETRYHQNRYFMNIEGLHYDTLTMRGLSCRFDGELYDIAQLDDAAVYHLTDYSAARQLGRRLRQSGEEGVQYRSVRKDNAICWALFTPRRVKEIKQTAHFEFIWDGQAISRVVTISQVRA